MCQRYTYGEGVVGIVKIMVSSPGIAPSKMITSNVSFVSSFLILASWIKFESICVFLCDINSPLMLLN